jgi:predicted pyridoxine 5'-phosphate oxidase superfamily flavin-nucleotide-binding protein
MSTTASDVAFTSTVKAIQSAKGSREAYAKMELQGGWETDVTTELAHFIAEQDMFFLGTANADGQPYIQHRGGPAGFLKVLDKHTLAFADFGGNQQYITLGNLQDNPKAFIFLIDYVNRVHIKLWGTARVIEPSTGDGELTVDGAPDGSYEFPKLLERLVDPEYNADPQRIIVFTVHAWDRNCPQHIQRRYPQSMIAPLVDHMKSHIAALEKQVRSLGADPVKSPE